MSSLADVFGLLNEMRAHGVIEDYAVGGGMAFLFHAEPTLTYDLDVFVLLPPTDRQLVLLTPIYEWLAARGFDETSGEHILVHGVPLQLLPAYNDLVDEAVEAASTFDYEGVPVRVTGAEHLAALAVQVGGRKRRERVGHLFDAGVIDRGVLAELLRRHGLFDRWQADWETGDE